ncbi:zygote arrest protein 1 [Megalops cyprinoides]|uniref:zygote arrest protein 1 n=1 Tax=Megalops cyprinoides TaxID=118141 RepID=UPI0018644B15|nr:zygote arrest protein 1 [Megalops cyprinoides]
MATYGDESIDSYLYSSYNPYSCRYLNSKSRGVGWRQKSYLANYGDAETYFDNHQRAQLKSILSQINPDLTPRLRKANTKDVGVQVNPKTDVSVQCSLGPRPLFARKRGALRRKADTQAPGSPVSSTVRYPRTLAVYSPIASRRLTSFLEPDKDEAEPAPAGEATETAEKGEGLEGERQTTGEEAQKPTDGKVTSEKEGPDEQPRKAEEIQKGEDGAKSKARVKFQFLEQKYGYYHCRDCNLRWESAYVWCVQGTSKVYFKQFCRTCQKAFNPYRVEDITCQSCKRVRCRCPVMLRHVDPKRPHRQDLCGRCKGKRLSCDSTFSFKYII